MSQSSSARFEWSLKPIIVLMAIFGNSMVIFPHKLNERKTRSVILLIIGWVVLLIDIFINYMSFANILTVNIAGLISGLQGPANFLSVVVGHFFHIFFMIGLPLSFTIISVLTRRWKDVLSTLETIQYEMNLPETMHTKLRNHAFFGIFMFILVIHHITVECLHFELNK